LNRNAIRGLIGKGLCLALLLYGGRAYAIGEGEVSSFTEKGMVYYSRGEVEKAIAEFNQGIQEDPTDYVAYFQRARAYEHLKRTEDAIDDYNQVTKQCPGIFLCEQAYYARGVLYHKSGSLKEAVTDYTSLIEAAPDNKVILANTYNNRAIAYDALGQYDLAIRDYNKAVDLVPKLVNAYYNRGVTYANMGVYPLSLQDFEKELELNPRSVYAMRYKSALMYYSRRDYKRSWFEVFSLMQSGENASRTLVKDLKKKLRDSLK
jgi:tetratricopeptide (TPR) repeat protein